MSLPKISSKASKNCLDDSENFPNNQQDVEDHIKIRFRETESKSNLNESKQVPDENNNDEYNVGKYDVVNNCEEVSKDDGFKCNSAASNFNDTECGDVLRSQHIRLDFTPTNEDEDEYVQKKCCDFWEFIYSQPQLRSLIVLPNIDSNKNIPGGCETLARQQEKEDGPNTLAIDWFKEDRTERVKQTFATKKTFEYCDQGDGSYQHRSNVKLKSISGDQ